MKPHSSRYAPLKAIVIVRQAIARGPLIKDCRAWKFGRRRFSSPVVAQLIELGEAVRDGDMVRAA